MMTYLCLNTWAGRMEHPVEIVKETPKRYLVRLLEDFPLPSARLGKAGDEVYVPKYAIKKVG